MTTTAEFVADQIARRPIEARIVRKTIRALKAAGKPVVQVYDGEEKHAVSTESEAMLILFNLDLAWIITEDGSWVRFIFGEQWDVVNDYTTNLEEIMTPISEYISARSN